MMTVCIYGVLMGNWVLNTRSLVVNLSSDICRRSKPGQFVLTAWGMNDKTPRQFIIQVGHDFVKEAHGISRLTLLTTFGLKMSHFQPSQACFNTTLTTNSISRRILKSSFSTRYDITPREQVLLTYLLQGVLCRTSVAL